MRTTIKSVVLTAIANKGLEQVKREINELAYSCLAAPSYIQQIIRKVESGEIIIKKNHE
jgi:hypothetical protein